MDTETLSDALSCLFQHLEMPCNEKYLKRLGLDGGKLGDHKIKYEKLVEMARETRRKKAKRKQATVDKDQARDKVREEASAFKLIFRHHFADDSVLMRKFELKTRYRNVNRNKGEPGKPETKVMKPVRQPRNIGSESLLWRLWINSYQSLENDEREALASSGWDEQRMAAFTELYRAFCDARSEQSQSTLDHKLTREDLKRFKRRLQKWYNLNVRLLRYEVTVLDPGNEKQALAQLGLDPEPAHVKTAGDKAEKTSLFRRFLNLWRFFPRGRAG
jgi:hypothetical protein